MPTGFLAKHIIPAIINKADCISVAPNVSNNMTILVAINTIPAVFGLLFNKTRAMTPKMNPAA